MVITEHRIPQKLSINLDKCKDVQNVILYRTSELEDLVHFEDECEGFSFFVSYEDLKEVMERMEKVGR